MDQNCWGPAVLWMNVKLAGPQQCYGWFWAHPAQMSTKLQTLAVLWMVLGPHNISETTKLPDLSISMDGFGPTATKLLDLSSFMDGFGLSEIDLIKTADLGSSMDYFSLGRKTIQNLFVIVPNFLFCGISFPLQSSHRYTMYPIQKRFTCHIRQVFPSVGY